MTLRCRPIIVDLVQVRQYFQLTETEPQPIQTQRIKKHKVENWTKQKSVHFSKKQTLQGRAVTWFKRIQRQGSRVLAHTRVVEKDRHWF